MSNRGILCWLGRRMIVSKSQLFKAIANMLSLLTQGFQADTDAVLLAYMLPVPKFWSEASIFTCASSGQVKSMSISLAVSTYIDLLQRPHNRCSQVLLLCCKCVLSQQQNLNCWAWTHVSFDACQLWCCSLVCGTASSQLMLQTECTAQLACRPAKSWSVRAHHSNKVVSNLKPY